MPSIVNAIAEQTGCTREQVQSVAGLVLEALHEESVKNEQVPGGILTASAWTFNPKVCYHLNGILREYLVRHPDDQMMIDETMLRFLPGEWKQFEPLVQKWKDERSDVRRGFDEATPDDGN